MVGLAAPDAIHLDLAGLECPIPVLRVRKALYRFLPGAVFTIFCDDPLSPHDIERAITDAGDAVLSVARRGGGVVITGCKSG